MMDGVIKLERGQNESAGIYFWESCPLSVTHRQFKISSGGMCLQFVTGLNDFIAKKQFHQLVAADQLFSLFFGCALIWADKEIKALSCDEGAAPRSVIINHCRCQTVPWTQSG